MLAYRLVTRDETRRLVYYLNWLGVALALKNGRVAARPIDERPVPIEALDLLKTHKTALLVYLTTEPVTEQPCAACGRNGIWMLDELGRWVCGCYYEPALQTWPKGTVDADDPQPGAARKVVDWQARAIVEVSS